jgi:hypothetical protein
MADIMQQVVAVVLRVELQLQVVLVEEELGESTLVELVEQTTLDLVEEERDGHHRLSKVVMEALEL